MITQEQESGKISYPNENYSNHPIRKYTLKKKFLCYFDNLATLHTGGKPVLTPEEIGIILEELQTVKGNRLFKKFLNIDPKVKYAMGTLLQSRLSYREQLAIIDKFSILKKHLSMTEKLLNTIVRDIADIDRKKKVTEYIGETVLRNNAELFSLVANMEFIKIDPEDISFSKKIDSHLKIHKEKAEADLIYFKTLLKATKDSMRASGFQIPRYYDIFKDIENDIKERGKEYILSDTYPNYKEAKIDEAKYEFFRREVI